ncbi:MAG: hypothetical protein WD645_01930, partial [Dehalococcoidia bacterium]
LHGSAPRLELDKWRDFCEGEDLAGKDHTVLLAQDETGYVRGIAGFRRVDHLQYGPVMDCTVFVASSIADARGVVEALVEALGIVSASEGRRGTLIRLAGLDPEVRDLLAGNATILTQHHILICAEAADE